MADVVALGVIVSGATPTLVLKASVIEVLVMGF
jgi:hypothetical protein